MTVTIYNWRTGAVILTIAEAVNCVGAQLAGFNLTDADFSGQNVRYADFSGANLTGANFDGCSTGQADFTGANLEDATFIGEDSSTPSYVLSKAFYEVFSSQRVNDVLWRNNAVQTNLATGQQRCIFYRRIQGKIVTATRDLVPTPGPWVYEVSAQAIQNANDGHHAVSFAFDGSGRQHVWWSWLDTSYRYNYNSTPDDQTVGAPVALPLIAGQSALESNPVYPEALSQHPTLGDDIIFTWWCAGSVPATSNLGTMIRRWDDAAATWSTITQSLFICGFNTYLCRTQIDSQGRLWVAGNYRSTSDITTNTDLVVAISDPADGALGSVWRDAAGNVLSLPVRPDDALNGVVYSIAENTGLMNSNGFVLDDDDHGIFGYWTGDPAEYHVTNQLADGSWIDRRVGAQGLTFTLVDNSSPDSFPLCQPALLYSAGNLYVFFRSTTFTGLWCYVLSDADLLSSDSLSTRVPVQVCEYDAVGYAPRYDEPLFRSEGLLHFFMSRASQLSADLGNMLPAYIAEVPLP